MKRIKKNRLLIVVLAAAMILSLAGCLQSETVIQVRPDGSGEVIERFAMAGAIVEMLAGFASMGGEQDFSLINENDMRARAEQMGPGVRFLGAEATSARFGEGYVARYAFNDINALRVNQNPSDNVPLDADDLPGESASEEYLTFSFRRGNPSTLEILLPQPEDNGLAGSDGSDAEGPAPDELAAAMQFYEDMRIAVRIEILGTVLETDASHRQGNTLTIMDIDFNRILQDQELTRAILGQGAGSLAEVQRLAQGAEGLEIESRDRITVTLR